MDDLTDKDQVYEEHEADNAKRNKFGVIQVDRAVSDCAAEDNDVRENKHSPARPSMDLAKNGRRLFLSPSLVPIVAFLEGGSKGPAED